METNRTNPLRIAVLTLACLALAATGAFAAERTETVTESFDLGAGGAVAVRGINGHIEVEAWDGSQVEIVATKKVKGPEARLDEALRKLELTIERDGDTVRAEVTKQSKGWFSWFTGSRVQQSVHFAVKVPRNTDLDLTTTNGHVDLTGVDGTINLRSTNGRLAVRDAAGAVTAATTNGAIDVELTSVTAGEAMKFHTTNGSIRLAVPPSLAADLDASTTNGRVRYELPAELSGRQDRRRLDGSVNGGGARISLRTTNGGIRIADSNAG